jgi:hypothetical protein
MFVRAKKSGKYQYLQLVQNERVDGRVRQQVLLTLGRLDVLQQSGQTDALVASCARFAQRTAVLEAYEQGKTQATGTIKIGPPLVFERLWRDLGLAEILQDLLQHRQFQFAVERAVFVTVLHRLFDPGSDRAAEVWHQGYAISGAASLRLQHLYRAMAWLGEVLPPDQQFGATPFAPRCTKDRIEEALFARRCDLFSSLDLVFFDTTSIYFEGRGGNWIDPLSERECLHDRRIVGYYHAAEHLHEAARAALGKDTPESWALAEQLKHAWWKGRLDEVIATLQMHAERLGAPQGCDGADHPRRVLANNVG